MEQLIRGPEGLPAWRPSAPIERDALRDTVLGFLDTCGTSFGRATHYNSRDAQQRAELAAHRAMLGLDRDLYALFLLLPGSTDRSAQVGLKNLLGTVRNGAATTLIGPAGEKEVLYRLVRELPPQRALKLFTALRHGSEKDGIPRANNARTRKLILRTILGSPKLDLWVVKYRRKVRDALTHAWGRRMTSIIKTILTKPGREWDAKEKAILHRHLRRYVPMGKSPMAVVCVSFVLGNDRAHWLEHWPVDLIQAREEAKQDFEKGSRLPPEVLEGLRSVYHKDRPKEEVLKAAAAAGTMTKGQRLEVQKRAKAAGVEVEVNFDSYDLVKLYIYAFENGVNEELAAALERKAKEAGKALPLRHNHVAIVVDGSVSMYGNKTQPLRPMATALAMRDVLMWTAAGTVKVIYAGGSRSAVVSPGQYDVTMIWPEGGTDLASSLLVALETESDVVYVISDGYENMPSGRFAQALACARDVGVHTPVFHINPVFAAESKGVRELAPGLAPTLPVQNPAAMATGFVRGLIETDPVQGINTLVGMTLPALMEGA